MPKVSVIMPSYNHGKYIAEAIRSVLDQEFRDFELIIVDDGSSDNTVEVARGIKDDRIRIIEFPVNQTACVAANRAIREANGDYLAMLSSDDMFLPHKLNRQVTFLDTHPEVLAVFGKAEIVDETGKPMVDCGHYYYNAFDQPNRSRFEWLNRFFYQGNCLCHPSAMLRRSCFESIGYYDERLALVADLEYWIRLCMVGNIHVLQENLIRFRVRDYEQNASGQRPEMQIRYAVEMIQILKHFTKIADVAQLASIFPQIAGEVSAGAGVVPFLVAKLALQEDNPVYQCFAIDVLFELLADPESAAVIKEQYQFGCRELIRLTDQYDVFNLVSGSLSKIYLDTGDGFSEQEIIPVRVNTASNRFKVTVSIDQLKPIQAIRWDPVEGRFARVKIWEAYYQGSGQLRSIEAYEFFSNGSLGEDGYYNFETFDPMFMFPVTEQINELTISGEWEFATTTEMEDCFRKSEAQVQYLRHLNGLLTERLEKLSAMEATLRQAETLATKNANLMALVSSQKIAIQDRDTLIRSLLNSFSWRITAPLRLVNRLVVRRN